MTCTFEVGTGPNAVHPPGCAKRPRTNDRNRHKRNRPLAIQPAPLINGHSPASRYALLCAFPPKVKIPCQRALGISRRITGAFLTGNMGLGVRLVLSRLNPSRPRYCVILFRHHSTWGLSPCLAESIWGLCLIRTVLPA